MERKDRWFDFWKQAISTQYGVMGSIAGLTVTALAIVTSFAQFQGGLKSDEKVISILIIVLLGLHANWLLQSVRNDRESSFISAFGDHTDPRRIQKSQQNNDIYYKMQYSLFGSWILVLILIVLIIR